MPRLALPLLFAALSLSLAACAPNDRAAADGSTSERVPSGLYPTTPAPPPPVEHDMDSCNADAARGVIGKTATAEVVEQARKAAGADIARTLKPGQIVTMEYRAGRLNIDVDERNVITNVRCG